MAVCRSSARASRICPTTVTISVSVVFIKTACAFAERCPVSSFIYLTMASTSTVGRVSISDAMPPKTKKGLSNISYEVFTSRFSSRAVSPRRSSFSAACVPVGCIISCVSRPKPYGFSPALTRVAASTSRCPFSISGGHAATTITINGITDAKLGLKAKIGLSTYSISSAALGSSHASYERGFASAFQAAIKTTSVQSLSSITEGNAGRPIATRAGTVSPYFCRRRSP